MCPQIARPAVSATGGSDRKAGFAQVPNQKENGWKRHALLFSFDLVFSVQAALDSIRRSGSSQATPRGLSGLARNIIMSCEAESTQGTAGHLYRGNMYLGTMIPWRKNVLTRKFSKNLLLTSLFDKL